MKGRPRTYRAVLLTLLALSATVFIQPALRAQEISRVGLVVRHGDGSTVVRCVEFTEPEITGLDVLNRAGLPVVADFSSGSGARICTIDGEGCPASDCWCECSGAPCVYWVYHHLVGGAWAYGEVGASAYKVHNGDVEGWAWGEGSPEGGAQPPVIPFDHICAPPATNTPAPPTDTPVPPTPVVWFRLDDNPVPAGQCTRVRWDTSGASEVYLDGQQVAASGDVQACPSAPEEYRLRVVSAAGEQTHTLVLGVEGTPVPSATATTSAPPSPTPTATRTPGTTPTPTRTVRPTATARTPRPTEARPSSTPSATPTPTPSPAATPSAPNQTEPTVTQAPETPTLAPSPTMQAPPPKETVWGGSGATGYAVFGTIAAGLVGLVVLLARRR